MVLDNKTKRIIITMLVLGALILLYGSIVHGMRAEWFRFGLSLAVCIIMVIYFTGALLAFKIDTRFNQLEKLLSKQHKTKKEEKRAEQDTDKTAEV